MDNKTELKLFVLDTNILMNDPSAIYHFDEHDIYLPMVVLEELDNHKTGSSEVARNVRQTNRMLVELMSNASHEQIASGLPIPSYANSNKRNVSGRLYFQTDEFDDVVPSNLPGHKVDNTILATALGLQKKYAGKRQVIIISKDINLRIKAGILGILAQDYYNDQVVDDVSLLHRGLHILDNDFWDTEAKDIDSWQEGGKTFYKVSSPLVEQWNPNDCISTEDNEFQAIVKKLHGNNAVVQLVRDYTQAKHSVWGINARNREQNFSLNLLLDPDIDFVSLQGSAGTGKTLLTIAAGLTQVLDQNRFSEILMTRVTIPVGEDIAFYRVLKKRK